MALMFNCLTDLEKKEPSKPKKCSLFNKNHTLSRKMLFKTLQIFKMSCIKFLKLNCKSSYTLQHCKIFKFTLSKILDQTNFLFEKLRNQQTYEDGRRPTRQSPIGRPVEHRRSTTLQRIQFPSQTSPAKSD